MQNILRTMGTLAAVALLLPIAALAGPPPRPLTRCPADAIVSGTVCIDRYEASVWRVPDSATANRGLVARIQEGRATAADLVAAGATQLGVGKDDYAPCADSGQGCAGGIYAVSLPGVTPSAFVNWFQAQQACTNSAKRLPSNAEWQAAVAGTPDPGADDGATTCNTRSALAVPTGSRSGCVSSRGVFDMVGNVYEWVADWTPKSTTCGAWSPLTSPTSDIQCFAGAAQGGEPGALARGGGFFDAAFAGPLAVVDPALSVAVDQIGFRCAR